MTDIIQVVTPRTDVIRVVDKGPSGPPGDVQTISYSKPGMLEAPYDSPFLYPITYDCTLDSVVMTVGVAPTGSDVVLDILKNSTTVYATGTGRPRIAAGQQYGTGSTGYPTQASFSAGDFLTFQIAEIGSLVPGANLTLAINLKRS